MSDYTPTTEQVRLDYVLAYSQRESSQLLAEKDFDAWHAAELRRAKTVSAEQVQAVARVLDRHNGNVFNEEALAEDALGAAGLLIEGDDQ